MVDGIQLDYKLKKGLSSIFNQKMFGRISQRIKNGKVYAYYIPGVLNEVSYFRVFEGRIFISTASKPDFDPVMKYCEKFEVSTVSKNGEEVFMKTAKEVWAFRAKERGLKIE